MSPRTREQFNNMRQEKRSLILQAALKLFAKYGYHSCPVSKIAKEAGISKGLIYNYFSGKQELLNALVKDATEKTMESFDINRDGILSKEEFFYFLDKLTASILENLDYWQFYVSVLSQPHVVELIDQNQEKNQNKYAQMLADFFKKYGCTDPEGETLIFSMTLKGTLMTFLLSPKAFPLEYAMNKIKEMYNKKLSDNKN
jgi:AcrR family transcriptional regulator